MLKSLLLLVWKIKDKEGKIFKYKLKKQNYYIKSLISASKSDGQTTVKRRSTDSQGYYGANDKE